MLYIDNVDDETEDSEDDLDENFHGDDMPASHCKMYVQDKIEEYSDEIFKLLDNGAHIYFCGLKGMMPGIQDTLKRVAEERGESWEQKLTQLRKNKQWHVEVSHSSSVYLAIKLTEEVARDKQSCFFFRKQVRLQETLTPKKLLILALQEAERNGNSIYIICLIRVEDSEDEDHTSQVEVLYSSIVRLPKFNLSPSGHSTLGQLAFNYMPVKFKFLRARACTRTSPLNLAIEILKWSEDRTNICVMYTLCPVLIKFFSNQCIHINNKSNVNSHHYLE
ncbi:unnamed protein product [Brassica rapa]|uniref:Oxidoreductase FAD/NAD(P)-binding domain-containing protein n=2 Tax=Brassica TaxID=3705 RepID=A0A8D9CVU7_BRACM|nr:unnamed protein product [Brassica napus]CAG7865807.1 unnamed protein product [Brassica rapa]CAG7906614.1 unnamed protein product [Brassica rapa]